MRKIIMPVSPKEVRQILIGEKTCLLKKYRPRSPVGNILLYVAPPFRYLHPDPLYHQILGEVMVVDIVEAEPSYIWQQYGYRSGLSRQEFDRQYKSSKRAAAYLLDNPISYGQPRQLNEYGFEKTIRSFVYVK